MQANSLSSIVKNNDFKPPKYLKEGLISENGWEYWKSEAASDPNSIEWVMNFTMSIKIQITNLSLNYYKFVKEYDLQIKKAYQLRNGVTYSPISYGLRFTNDNKDLLKSDNTSLSFSLTRNVNKNTF